MEVEPTVDSPTRWYDETVAAEQAAAASVGAVEVVGMGVSGVTIEVESLAEASPTPPEGAEASGNPPPPQNFPRAWFCPSAAQASQVELPVSSEPLRRPSPSESEPEPMEIAISMESPAPEKTREEWIRTGAIPHRLASEEEIESRAAEHDLESYLREERANPEGHVEELEVVEVPRVALVGIVPVESVPARLEEENWDDDAPHAPRPIATVNVPGSESRSRHRSKGRASRYNPRRHLERDDFESVVSQRRSSPSPNRENRRPWARERESREREVRPRREESTGRGERHARIGGIKFGNLAPIPTDPRVDPPAYSCFNCWQEGHYAMQCPRPRVRSFCYNCGRSGVDMTVCPRCSIAYRRMIGTESMGTRPGRENARPYPTGPLRERHVNFAPEPSREQWRFYAPESQRSRDFVPPRWGAPRAGLQQGPYVEGQSQWIDPRQGPRDPVLEAIRVLEETRRMSDYTREGLIRRLYL